VIDVADALERALAAEVRYAQRFHVESRTRLEAIVRARMLAYELRQELIRRRWVVEWELYVREWRSILAAHRAALSVASRGSEDADSSGGAGHAR
jgi:hypothetical protein